MHLSFIFNVNVNDPIVCTNLRTLRTLKDH